MRDTETSYPEGRSPNLAAVFPKARAALEASILDLLSCGWEEEPRRRTVDMAMALRQAARNAGWWESEAALRVVESLLSLSSREVLPIRAAVREKMLELLGVLQKAPASRSA